MDNSTHRCYECVSSQSFPADLGKQGVNANDSRQVLLDHARAEDTDWGQVELLQLC